MDDQDKKAFDALDELQPYVASEYANAIDVALQAIDTLAKIRELCASVPDAVYVCTPPQLADSWLSINRLVRP
jgi:predicted dehydrogenase